MPRKGQKQTEEAKRKIREGNLGKKVSEETRRKMREAWKKRPPIPPEVRKKMADALRGRKYSDEHRAAISEGLKGEGNPMYGRKGKDNPHYGRKRSKKTRHNISEAMKGKLTGEKNPMYGRTGENSPLYGRIQSEETKNKISASILGEKHPMYGKHLSEEQKLKISNSLKGKFVGENNPNYGKIASLETRIKMSEARLGEKNPRWLGGISFEPYGIEFNNMLKRKIRKRDNYTCQFDGKRGKDCHHIDYNKNNNEESNLITLCRRCHTMTNKNRSYWKRLFTDMIRNNFKLNKKMGKLSY